jgi:hypothetical protein
MKWYLRSLVYLILCLAPAMVLAQVDCPALIQAALDATQQFCTAIDRNQACYGNVTLLAQPQPGIDDDELIFEKPGDRVSVADVSTLTLSPWDEAQNTWGISLMKLQANLPATLPGQNVTFLLFGNVAIDNAVYSNTEGPRLQIRAQGEVNVYSAASADQEVVGTLADGDSATAIGRIDDSTWLQVKLQSGANGWVQADQVKADDSYSFLDVVDADSALTPLLPPMQAFYFQTGAGDAPCAEAPDSGILVQTPGGSRKIEFTANEVTITLGSTAYLQAQPAGDMTVSVVEGQAEVSAQGVTVTVPAGAQVRIPIDASRAASGPPGAVVPYTGRDVQGLPVRILERAISIAPPLGEATPEATADGATAGGDAPLISGTWDATSDLSDCPATGFTGFSTLTHELIFEADADTGALIMSWADGRIVGWTFERVEDGVYRNEIENGDISTITILSPDHFTLYIAFPMPSDMGCTFSRSEYVLVSAAR